MSSRTLILSPFSGYSGKFSKKKHIIAAIISFVVYVSMIIFAFVPLTQTIAATGSTTMELQQAKSRSEVDNILANFGPVMTEVRLLSLADYIFIVAGFFLFFSLHSIVYQSTSEVGRWRNIPLIGMLLTVISRSLDSLENLWVILMYSNPQNYPTVLIPLVNYTENAKWLVVGIEYSFLGLSILLGILNWINGKQQENHK